MIKNNEVELYNSFDNDLVGDERSFKKKKPGKTAELSHYFGRVSNFCKSTQMGRRYYMEKPKDRSKS